MPQEPNDCCLVALAVVAFRQGRHAPGAVLQDQPRREPKEQTYADDVGDGG